MNMSRWLGVDHGTKRIGLAVGGADGITTPLEVIGASPADNAVKFILRQADMYGVEGVVVGLPLNMDGSEGPQAALARSLAATIRASTSLDVRLWDERLSSFEADQALAGILTAGKRKARQDAVAAAKMLLDFLSRGGPETAQRPD